ncbi:MAG: indolepyruvate/phenylpyruvate decarboxylase [Roseateles sp.]
MPTTTLAQRLVDALLARGAREIFGIPGDFALPLFREIERDGRLPILTLAHEPGVGFAADAAARVRGALGVAAVTYGAGALNLVNAVAGAYAERVPLVVLSGAPAAHEAVSGLLLHHQVKQLDSQWRLYEEITADRARLDDLERAPQAIARVLDTALARSRPVYLEIPRDMPGKPCAAVPAPAIRTWDAERVAAAADELLARLRAARDPLLVVGVEVRRYGLEARVAELARRLGLPVITSFMGRGLLTETGVPDVRLAGTYLGLAGDPELSHRVEHSDALLLLGVIVSDTNFAVSARRIDFRHALVAYDDELRVGHHVYPELPLAALIDALLERCPAQTQAKLTAVAAPPAPPAYPHELPEDDEPVAPDDIARAINDLFARHGPMPIASDVGDCLFTAMALRPSALLAPGYYATMGYGVPAGLGLQRASGQRPLILVGDGAFQMTGWEIGHAARLGLDPIVLVFNNSGWEMLRSFLPEGGFHELGRWDFAAMAAGMNGDGHAVHTRAELGAALRKAVASRGRFQLIDIRLAPGARSPTLQRFVAAVKRLAMPTS